MASMFTVVLFTCILQQIPAAPAETFVTLTQKARAEYWAGRVAQSEKFYLAALKTSEPIGDADRAQLLSDLGDVYVNEDQLPEAEHMYLKAFAIYEKLADKKDMALLLRNLGAVYSLQRRDEEALSVLRKALKVAKTEDQLGGTFVGQTLNTLGMVYFRQGDVNKAEDFFNQAVRTLPNAESLNRRADLLNNLGAVYHAKHQFEKAEQYLNGALKVTEGQVGPNHPDLTFTLAALALLYVDMRQYTNAEQQYLRAINILSDKPVFETRVARLLHGLSRNYAKGGRKADAAATLARAAALARKHVAEHADLASIMDDYALLLRSGGKNKEAEEYRAEAKRARVAAGLVVNAHTFF
jgi:tetratricopeptide (TPR) repeat protein